MKKFGTLLLLTLLVGCSSSVSLVDTDATVVKKVQTQKGLAEYTIKGAQNGYGTEVTISMPADMGDVGDKVVFTNKTMTLRTPVIRLED